MNPFLTNAIKINIRHNIKEYVNSQYVNIDEVKEVEFWTRKLTSDIENAVNDMYPKEDMLILKKYSVEKSHSEIKINIRDGGKSIQLMYYKLEIPSITFKFNNTILIPALADLFTIIKRNFLERTIQMINMNWDIECEKLTIVGAYMAQVNKFKKISALLSAHPDFERFIPKESQPIISSILTPSEQMRIEFEKNIIK